MTISHDAWDLIVQGHHTSADIWWLLKARAVGKWAVRILLECFLVTGRDKVVAKVIFLHLSVILFTGGSASVHAGIPPPP